MALFGQCIIYILMGCALAGAIASIVKEDSELGNQFSEGLNAIGSIFLPVAGIMAASPLITKFVASVFGPAFSLVGADPSMAATTFIAVDMGGYQLADQLAQTRESWIMAMTTGYMAGATIIFSIPVALKMIEKKDRPYLALGIMSGFLTIPIGVLITSAIAAFSHPAIRESISTDGAANYTLQLGFGLILKNLIPLIIICALIAIGLFLIPDAMIRGFTIFGKVIDALIRLVFIACVIEFFTGLFSNLFGGWIFDPIIADEQDVNRALEISGYVGLMLCGAFPMVYLIRTYLSRPLGALGKRFGLSNDATTGLLASSANVLALFATLKNFKRAEDKVLTIAFSVCGAFLIGDHLSFTANFQPNLILIIMVGKLAAGILAIILAKWIAVPKARIIEKNEKENAPDNQPLQAPEPALA